MATRKQAIQRIVDAGEFKEVEQIALEMKQNWMMQSAVKDTEFLTSKATIEKEAKIAALTAFLDELSKIAHG